MSERKKSFLRLGSSGSIPIPTPTPEMGKSFIKKNIAVDTSANATATSVPSSTIPRNTSTAPKAPSLTPQAATPKAGMVADASLPEAETSAIQTLDLPECLIEAHASMPSISPRDKLSYVDDKKTWKEFKQYEENMAVLNILVGEMESAVIVAKPDDIPAFLVDVFFNERNLLEVRKTIEQRTRFIVG